MAFASFLGCETAPDPAGPDNNADGQTLKKENEELRAQIDLLSRNNVEAVNLLNDIMDNLAKITGQENEVRDLQGDLDPATWDASSELREQILGHLQILQDEIKKLKEENTALSGITDRPENAALKRTIENLNLMLEAKERTVASLRDEMDSLAQQAEELRREVDEDRERIATLQKEAETREEIVSHQEETISKLRKDVSARYFLAGTPDQIRAALNRGDISKHFRTFRVSDDVLSADRPPRGFQAISPEESEIPLGLGGSQVKVLSVHKRNSTLYYARCQSGECFLRLRDPWAFWSISHHLIVEIRP